MKSLRSVLVGVTAASLLGLPGAAAAATPSPGPSLASAASSAALSRYDTSIRYLSFDHSRAYGSPTKIRGQVVATVRGQRGAVRHVRVKLSRRVFGTGHWKHLKTTYTSRTDRPRFRFRVKSPANARYRVAFGGNAKLQPTRKRTTVVVHRKFNARLEDGTGRFHGRVIPNYAHRRIFLDRRECASCGWDRVRSARTGDRGRWSFKVGTPTPGKTWWRVSTPASTKFIRSYSSVFTTERR